jgi:hypothetical protein
MNYKGAVIINAGGGGGKDIWRATKNLLITSAFGGKATKNIKEG